MQPLIRLCLLLDYRVTPEMLNWMLPAEKRRPFSKGKDKPWKHFVNANHPDVVELALVRSIVFVLSLSPSRVSQWTD